MHSEILAMKPIFLLVTVAVALDTSQVDISNKEGLLLLLLFLLRVLILVLFQGLPDRRCVDILLSVFISVLHFYSRVIPASAPCPKIPSCRFQVLRLVQFRGLASHDRGGNLCRLETCNLFAYHKRFITIKR